VFLVRHGATRWSKSGQHTGRTEQLLLPEGEQDARRASERLRQDLDPHEPVAVFSSPLERARATCSIAGFGSDAVLDADLVEWDYGDYEGLTTKQIQSFRPGWELFRDGCPGGESFGDVAARARRVIERLRSAPELSGGAAILFAHGHLLRVLAAEWADLGGPAARALPLETGRVAILGWTRAGPAITAWNL
jgi:probable phosphoglycerate mutase